MTCLNMRQKEAHRAAANTACGTPSYTHHQKQTAGSHIKTPREHAPPLKTSMGGGDGDRRGGGANEVDAAVE
jgi:hypothetical protein